MQNPEAEKLYKQAVDRAVSRDSAGALPLFDKALALDPDNAQYYSDKAITLLNLERYDETIECSLKATARDPRMVEPWINRGAAYGKLGRYTEAEQALEHAVEFAPDNPYARANLSTLYKKTGESEKSEEQGKKTQDILVPEQGRGGLYWIIAGVITGWLFFSADQMGSAYLKWAAGIMFFITCLFYFSSLQQALIIKKEVKGLSAPETRLNTNPVRTGILVLCIMGCAFGIGIAAAWLVSRFIAV
jgi:tetratricopeptide (TPR) repeat protein